MIDVTEQRLKMLKQQGVEPKRILDIGAYVGNWANMVHQIWSEAVLVMIEPNVDCKQRLENLQIGTIEVALLGNRNVDSVEYFASTKEFATGNSIHLEQSSYFQGHEIRKLKMVRLDDLVVEKGYEKFDFIKIDTQGSELEVVEGGTLTIKQAEIVCLETQNLQYNMGAPKTLDLMNKMDELGFQLFDITEIHHLPSGEMVQVDMMFARKDSKLIRKGKLW